MIVGDDMRAVMLWKALYDDGVYTNVAIHPAVPPAGALLRTSLMATHEREHLDRALEIFAAVIERAPELVGTDPIPVTGGIRCPECLPLQRVVSPCPLGHKADSAAKKLLLATATAEKATGRWGRAPASR